MTIEELRQQGYKVWVEHMRRCSDGEMRTLAEARMASAELLPHGGFTFVSLIKDEMIIAETSSRCSNRDNFSRKRGLLIALGRMKKRLDAQEL